MFSRLSTIFPIVALTFATFAAAAPQGGGGSCAGSNNQFQCCQNVEPAGNVLDAALISLLGLVAADVIGIDCVSVANCNQQAACCGSQTYNDILIDINLSCTSIA